MSKYFSIGKVVQIDGSRVTIWIKNFRNFKTISYNNKEHIGVFIGSFIGILRDSKKIVIQITSESIINIGQSSLSSSFWGDEIPRQLVGNIIGVLKKDDTYETATSSFPLIFDDVILLNSDELKRIFYLSSESTLKLGKSLVYNFDVCLPIAGLFNNHIGIFGTTTSGKTNTLVKLYSSFSKKLPKSGEETSQITFVFIDFNNEYSNLSINQEKKIIEVQSKEDKNSENKWTIPKDDFWDIDFFTTLLNISEKKGESILLKELIKELKGIKDWTNILENVENKINELISNSNINNTSNEDVQKSDAKTSIINTSFLETFQNVLDLFSNFIHLGNNYDNSSPILIFQFDKANMKHNKTIFSMIANILYKKQNSKSSSSCAIYLIIDEAHSILPEKDINETTEEKAIFRLNLFEKIVKEGRKHNFFLTISAQDPWTINSKIISQLDHFFIHRFKYSDLEKIKPIINLHNSYYDKLPILNNGECVMIGSKLKTPLLIKVEKVKNT